MAAPRVTIDQLPEQTVATVTDLWVVQSGSTTKKMAVSKIIDSISATVDSHVNTVADAHDASAISVVPIAGTTGVTVQGVLEELAARVAALETPTP